MLCESCGEHEATVHLTQMVNGQVRKLHLCEECAEQSGISISSTVALSDVLFGMGGSEDEEPGAEEKSCPRCELTKADFKKTSRLGCPECYVAFAEELEPVLAAMQKGTQHTGKVPSAEMEAMQVTAELEAMQRQLRDAVAAERYEEAAELRDRIRVEKERIAAGQSRRRRHVESD